MAAPRVFISSTYYDLHHVRNDIRTFVESLGYEAVMHDKGNIPYTQDVSIEDSCYNEIDSCDILICIIGNKFGTQSSSGNYSITMNELLRAVNRKKKVYTYILSDVLAENLTYLQNKNSGFVPYHVDDIKVHDFIINIKENILNHPITPFRDVIDIITSLKQQFAGLFQHLLSQEAAITETKTFSDLQDVANTIKKISSDFSEEQLCFWKKFDSSIFATKYALREIENKLGIKEFSILTSTLEGIREFLSRIGFKEQINRETGYLFEYDEGNNIKTLQLSNELFTEDGLLKDIRSRKTAETYIKYSTTPKQTFINEDDLPF